MKAKLHYSCNRLIPLLLVLFFVTSCVVQRSPVTGNKRAYGYSWEQELKIGKEADGQIQQQYGVYEGEEVTRYVEQVGQEVLKVSHMRRDDTPAQYRDTEFHFRVLNSPIVNAFALPGGYVYVTRGLLTHLNNEAQLAVVLGHEIGHVAARHASQRAFEQKIGQVALVGGAVLGQELLGLPGQDLLNLGGTAAQFLFLKYGRDDERESDRLGVEYSAMLRYEAAEGAAFFTSLKRISERSGQGIPSFLSTHPDPEEREQSIPRMAEQWRKKGYEQSVLNRDTFLKVVDGMIFGDNPREGFAEGGVFYHPDLAFRFPFNEAWTIYNEPSRVVVANSDKDAVVIMQIDAGADTPRSSVRNFTGQEGITVTREATALHNGIEGYEAEATAKTGGGAELGLFVYALRYDGRIYRFISYTTAEKYGTFLPEFRRTPAGFAPLSDPSVLNVQPVRLRVIRTDRPGPFSGFLPGNLPMDITPEEMAIVNQVEVEETIPAGTYLKIPVQE